MRGYTTVGRGRRPTVFAIWIGVVTVTEYLWFVCSGTWQPVLKYGWMIIILSEGGVCRISVILYIYTKYAHIGVIINADVTVAHIYGNAIVPTHLILKRTFE